ncbi:hypothetical protein HELRODRAFT_87016 [Helobdella robusta]|uniref:Cytochrome c oxidase assembly protein COX15 homolog n=1 Tax=Helobdella robusta TaxID=6412 RepID=T1G6K6_HELRO|nr:hypothetical protein HELRODRAFT_87016 [Helobdella robusta]ESN95219.1 hypothetical protein HELRODRAFT_87016 [Helobdella robusta]
MLTKNDKRVGRWLLACSGMCFGAIVIGGITRLTESGLSITQWNVIKGMRPPRTEDEWEKEFTEYKKYPEYKYLERELTLEGFKKIFFWEYIHRMWGRSIGLVFLLPAVFFWKKGYFNKGMKIRTLIYGSLIGAQGVLGWYMVKSGLEEHNESTITPRVSQYRLAAHLTSALVLYSLFFYQGLNHLLEPQQFAMTSAVKRLKMMNHTIKALVVLTAISGAFVAGLDGGLVYNTWPKMADKWIPDDLMAITPKWKNAFENVATVQFIHRHLGELTGGLIFITWLYSRKVKLPPRAKFIINCLAAAGLLQGLLGIATLLSFVPVHLASAHQGGAVTVLSFALWVTHELRRMPK